MAQTDMCEKCGKIVTIGDFPFCPHENAQGLTLGEEPLEPYVDYNLGPEPVTITTRGQRRKLMAEQGLEFKRKKEPKLGRVMYFDLGK